jgi:sterol desaturase/sphingolipid hydroxylase (fatty acid hydroxylase superfamily)
MIRIGAPAAAVFIFELLLDVMSSSATATSSYQSDLTLVVIPEMHRVHHPIKPSRTNSNFGFNLPRWDCVPDTRKRPSACNISAIRPR